MKLMDPGKNEKDLKKQKDARMKAWKKPANNKERDELREQRCADWRGWR